MSGGQKKILIVENDEGIRMVLKLYLQDQGYEVIEAENGRVALEAMERGEKPDLMFMDMKMPIMNGWDLAAEFRKRYGTEIPIIVLSAAGDLEKRVESIQITASIPKPFMLKDIGEALKVHLKSR